jgi:hypothetical protein
MQFERTLAALGVAAIMTVAGATTASALTVNLGGPDATAASFNYLGGALSVTGERNCGGWENANVSRASDGLGVRARVGSGCLAIGDSSELDGQIDERMTFTFSRSFVFEAIAFNNIDGDDPYNIFVDTGSGFALVAGSAMTNPYVFSPFLTGNRLRIAVDGNASAFRVASISLSEVPLPAAGWMLLVGLGGIAAMKRRRKAA